MSVRVPVTRVAKGEHELEDAAARYLARVLRARPGDAVTIFDPAAAVEATATVLEVGRRSVRCSVGEPRPASVRPSRDVTLVQGVPKGDKLDAIVRDATELGATRVVVADTSRAVVRLGAKGAGRIERLRRVAVEAARQSGRGDAPRVEGPLAWADAIAAATDPAALLVCAWERAEAPLGPSIATLAPGRPVVVAVGPEGGLDAEEAAVARDAGFALVSLGDLVLRTETVAAALLGAVAITAGACR